VDEDDDEEEEEEEELGWDDEDEEEEEQRQNEPTASTVNTEKALVVAGDNEPDDSVDTEQIEFHDEALDKTKEELKQAVLERDLLQQTVELLKKELANSKNTAAAMPAAPPSSSLSVEVETLLKEKDAEIETLKASLLQMVTAASEAASSTSASLNDEAATVKVQELTQSLAAKDREYEATTRALQDEIISLRAKLATSEAVAAKEAEDMKRHVDQSSATMAALTTQLADARAQLVQAQAEVQQLRTEVEEQRHHQDSGDKTSEDSGVPVEAPRIVMATTTKSSTTTTTKRGGGDDDDEDGETSDGWGDEW
jgi:chromosome segregation ATPase